LQKYCRSITKDLTCQKTIGTDIYENATQLIKIENITKLEGHRKDFIWNVPSYFIFSLK